MTIPKEIMFSYSVEFHEEEGRGQWLEQWVDFNPFTIIPPYTGRLLPVLYLIVFAGLVVMYLVKIVQGVMLSTSEADSASEEGSGVSQYHRQIENYVQYSSSNILIIIPLISFIRAYQSTLKDFRHRNCTRASCARRSVPVPIS